MVAFLQSSSWLVKNVCVESQNITLADGITDFKVPQICYANLELRINEIRKVLPSEDIPGRRARMGRIPCWRTSARRGETHAPSKCLGKRQQDSQQSRGSKTCANSAKNVSIALILLPHKRLKKYNLRRQDCKDVQFLRSYGSSRLRVVATIRLFTGGKLEVKKGSVIVRNAYIEFSKRLCDKNLAGLPFSKTICPKTKNMMEENDLEYLMAPEIGEKINKEG
eukprot:augustus_masked-scaffold_101-processed-gene-0.13-mRNA-1 protein AED:1.00 eAED:1.00 QI:0/0/0/0/1/1/2/0/222